MTLNEDDDVEWRSRRLQGPGVLCPSVLELYTLLFGVLFHAMVAMETTCSSLENILCTVRSSVCLLSSVIQTVSCSLNCCTASNMFSCAFHCSSLPLLAPLSALRWTCGAEHVRVVRHNHFLFHLRLCPISIYPLRNPQKEESESPKISADENVRGGKMHRSIDDALKASINLHQRVFKPQYKSKPYIAWRPCTVGPHWQNASLARIGCTRVQKSMKHRQKQVARSSCTQLNNCTQLLLHNYTAAHNSKRHTMAKEVAGSRCTKTKTRLKNSASYQSPITNHQPIFENHRADFWISIKLQNRLLVLAA